MSFTTLLLWIIGLAYFAVCFWMVVVVLLQEGKSGGFGAGESSASAPGALTDSLGAGGAQKSLFRMTAYTAVAFFVLAILLTRVGNYRDHEGGVIQLPAQETGQGTMLQTSPDPAGDEPPVEPPPVD